jgi:hypothetical protein
MFVLVPLFAGLRRAHGPAFGPELPAASVFFAACSRRVVFCGRRRGRRADQDHSDRDTAGSAAVGIAYMALVLAALIAILYPLGLFRGQ